MDSVTVASQKFAAPGHIAPPSSLLTAPPSEATCPPPPCYPRSHQNDPGQCPGVKSPHRTCQVPLAKYSNIRGAQGYSLDMSGRYSADHGSPRDAPSALADAASASESSLSFILHEALYQDLEVRESRVCGFPCDLSPVGFPEPQAAGSPHPVPSAGAPGTSGGRGVRSPRFWVGPPLPPPGGGGLLARGLPDGLSHFGAPP